jgi:threonylcarbamoyladenosine tRNA methylthiotransferase MtaB
MLRFAVTTLGCKVNQYDGQALSSALEAAGWARAPDHSPADLLVINTCCVTASAMAKCRYAIRRAVRNRPDAAVFIAGCYSDYDQMQLRKTLEGLGVPSSRTLLAGHHHDVAAVLGDFARRLEPPGPPAGKPDDAHPGAGRGQRPAPLRVPGTIRARRLAAVKSNVPATRNLPAIGRFPGRQRALVKIQDGCDAFCSYCIVPYTRPRVWSRRPDEILLECRRLADAGHREIVLCGVFLGAFGRQTAIRRNWPAAPTTRPKKNALAELMRRVCDIPGLWRVRLSSLEPLDVADELLDVLANCPKAAPHLHLPLQSGSPEILRRINRQYTADQYLRCAARVRQALDRPALTTDIIVGLPGETDDDFARTLDVVREVGFSEIHAFPFSPVEPTAAWRQRDQAPPLYKVKARLAELAEAAAETARAYRMQFLGQTVEAVVERPSPAAKSPAGGGAGHCPLRKAMTDRHLTVSFAPPAGARGLTGQVIRLTVRDVTPGGLAGAAAQ